eukprot:UN08923
MFRAETFFQRPLENFLQTLLTCSRYTTKLDPCVSKKS